MTAFTNFYEFLKMFSLFKTEGDVGKLLLILLALVLFLVFNYLRMIYKHIVRATGLIGEKHGNALEKKLLKIFKIKDQKETKPDKKRGT